jgi:hypothetical protein
MSWSRHRHCGSVRWFVPAARSVVLIRLGLETLERGIVSMAFVELRQALVAIEKEDMSVSRQFGVESNVGLIRSGGQVNYVV